MFHFSHRHRTLNRPILARLPPRHFRRPLHTPLPTAVILLFRARRPLGSSPRAARHPHYCRPPRPKYLSHFPTLTPVAPAEIFFSPRAQQHNNSLVSIPRCQTQHRRAIHTLSTTPLSRLPTRRRQLSPTATPCHQTRPTRRAPPTLPPAVILHSHRPPTLTFPTHSQTPPRSELLRRKRGKTRSVCLILAKPKRVIKLSGKITAYKLKIFL